MNNPFKDIRYFSDKETISSGYDDLSVRYHYNFIENGIIRNLEECSRVLDIGPGYGHWVLFFKEIYHANVNVVDISQKVVSDLIDRYGVIGYCTPIEKFDLKIKYDVINAIGVFHHIMSEKALRQTLANMFELLSEGGTLFIATRSDFINNVREGYKIYRTLWDWRDLLLGFEVSILRSDPPWHCRKHLDLIIAKRI